MRIEGPNLPIGPALLAALAAKSAAGEAKAALADPPAPPAAPIQGTGTQMPSPATSVAMLVTLAAVDPPADRRRRAITQASRGLDQLERLRDELETGLASPERLHEMAQWSRSFAAPDSPEIAELAREIELRVRVELAKHDIIL